MIGLGSGALKIYLTVGPDAGDPQANEWDAWGSLKLRDSAYERGSKKPNGAWMDRVLLVRPRV